MAATENPAVSAGRRDKQIRLEQGTKENGRSTRPVMRWDLLDDVWAHQAVASGSERFRASQIEAVFDTTFTIPYRADMDPDRVDVPTLRRVVFEGRAFDIVFARQVGRRRGIELATRAGSRLE